MLTPRVPLALIAALGLAAGPAAATEGTSHSHGATHDTARDHGVQVVQLAVTKEGFVPSRVTVKAGQPVKLVVTRKTEQTCATEIVMKDFGVKQDLPLEKPVTVSITPKKPGEYRYACGMDMIAGVLEAK